MFNRTPNMTEISGLTVQLDELHQTYATLFEEAQRQLEALDFTDTHISRVARTLSQNDAVVRNIQTETVAALANNLKELTAEDLESEYIARGLLDALESRLWKRFESRVEEQIVTIVEAKVAGLVEAAVTNAVANNPEIQKGQCAEFVLTQLYSYFENVQTKDPAKEDNEATG